MSEAYEQGGAEAPEAIRVLWREHANILQVMNCLEDALDEPGVALSRSLIDNILDYMEGFADTLHHPKEEHYLMPALVRRQPDLALLVQKVQEEHDQGAAAMAELKQYWAAAAHDPDAEAHFRELAKDYAEFQKRHMTREDRGLFPVALEILTDEDMAALSATFTRTEDPLIGEAHQDAYRRLFEAILAAAPVSGTEAR